MILITLAYGTYSWGGLRCLKGAHLYPQLPWHGRIEVNRLVSVTQRPILPIVFSSYASRSNPAITKSRCKRPVFTICCPQHAEILTAGSDWVRTRSFCPQRNFQLFVEIRHARPGELKKPGLQPFPRAAFAPVMLLRWFPHFSYIQIVIMAGTLSNGHTVCVCSIWDIGESYSQEIHQILACDQYSRID